MQHTLFFNIIYRFQYARKVNFPRRLTESERDRRRSAALSWATESTKVTGRLSGGQKPGRAGPLRAATEEQLCKGFTCGTFWVVNAVKKGRAVGRHVLVAAASISCSWSRMSPSAAWPLGCDCHHPQGPGAGWAC